MPRQILDHKNIHPAVQSTVADNHADIVAEVQLAISNNKVVIVGMAQNPAPKRARKVLDELGVEHAYLEYGNYFSLWRRRNALKMWSGWPSFPMIFVNGVLIGGSSDMRALIASGEFTALLK
ncbi:MAG: glutaredoxin domain-containing protein [Porticoccaceae bacterium]|jgi:monothiol glutaredoxin|nr:glutaredoxin domain-containing protein [Porticoccaceae bacterium]